MSARSGYDELWDRLSRGVAGRSGPVDREASSSAAECAAVMLRTRQSRRPFARVGNGPILMPEAVHMNEAVLLSTAVIGLLILIGLAGLLYDRLHKRDRSISDDTQRRATQTARYYRDVGDSNNSGGGW